MKRFDRITAKLALVFPVIVAAALGLVLSNLTMTDAPSVKASPFDKVESKPVSLIASNAAQAEVASNQDFPTADNPQSAPMSVSDTLKSRSGGAGYQPRPMESGCDCGCLDEKEIRKIVSDEFNNQKLAEAVAPRSYGSVAASSTYYPPATSYSTHSQPTYSQPVVYSQSTYSQPQTTTTVRRGLFGRRIITTQSVPQSTAMSAPMSGTCRIVNGVKVCTP